MHPHTAHEDKRRRERVTSVMLLAGVFLPLASVLGNSSLLGGGAAPAVTTPALVQPTPVVNASPSHITIPSLNLSAPIIPVGLNEDGTVEVPERVAEVGWYELGARPGERGSAVLLGHRSSWTGPGVFRAIRALEEGEELTVAFTDGTMHVFSVVSVAEYPQDAFPTALVYGDTDESLLRLVTCSGSYLPLANRFTHNTIVTAQRI